MSLFVPYVKLFRDGGYGVCWRGGCHCLLVASRALSLVLVLVLELQLELVPVQPRQLVVLDPPHVVFTFVLIA